MLSVNSARAGGWDLFGLAIAELTKALYFTLCEMSRGSISQFVKFVENFSILLAKDP